MQFPAIEMQPSQFRCDIFCHVIDNYGDIGVCWRLAWQLAHEYGWAVRLWLDELSGLASLYPSANALLDQQACDGVQVFRWRSEFPDVSVADMVIETFACQLPLSYVQAMAARLPQPVWLNLEYLSAEDWVGNCHGLPSPHPLLPIRKYYFFPGFTQATGGLLIENELLRRREAFQGDMQQQSAFWSTLGMAMPGENILKVSLFSYENAALHNLFNAWARSAQPVLCLIPVGRVLPQVSAYFGRPLLEAGSELLRGALCVKILPFLSQQEYDRLLWACDVNFVRGEDSFVRAQWAARPLVWHIYPQHDQVHHGKLEAFLRLYTAGISESARQAVYTLWQSWSGETEIAKAWDDFAQHRAELSEYGRVWVAERAQNNLVVNLLDFYRNFGTIRASQISDWKS
jgi:uncharacterized repeat protein (TIGR03837 family)